jgi:hypothetical protein
MTAHGRSKGPKRRMAARAAKPSASSALRAGVAPGWIATVGVEFAVAAAAHDAEVLGLTSEPAHPIADRRGRPPHAGSDLAVALAGGVGGHGGPDDLHGVESAGQKSGGEQYVGGGTRLASSPSRPPPGRQVGSGRGPH